MALAPFPNSSEPDEEQLDDVTGSDAGKMSFLDHLDELRKRLSITAFALLGGFIICFSFITPIFDFIMRPLQEILPDGLYAHEKKFAIPFVVFATLFFVGGALFSHFFLFPVAWSFFAGFASDYMEFMPRIQPAFSLYVKLLLACGVVFQMPTVVFFLARIGVLTARFLVNNIKYAILLIFIFAAILTPTGDPVTLTLMAMPMILLYGLSIGIAWLFGKKTKSDS